MVGVLAYFLLFQLLLTCQSADFEKKKRLLWTDHNNSGKLSHILIILMNAFQESVISLVKASYA